MLKQTSGSFFSFHILNNRKGRLGKSVPLSVLSLCRRANIVGTYSYVLFEENNFSKVAFSLPQLRVCVCIAKYVRSNYLAGADGTLMSTSIFLSDDGAGLRMPLAYKTPSVVNVIINRTLAQITVLAVSPLSSIDPSFLLNATAANYLQDQRDHCQHEQNMDQRSKCIAGKTKAKCPKHHQNNDYCPKHNVSPFDRRSTFKWRCVGHVRIRTRGVPDVRRLEYTISNAYLAFTLLFPVTGTSTSFVTVPTRKINAKTAAITTNAPILICIQLTPRYAFAVSSRTETSSPSTTIVCSDIKNLLQTSNYANESIAGRRDRLFPAILCDRRHQ